MMEKQDRKKRSLHNRTAKCANLNDLNISYRTLPSNEDREQKRNPGSGRELSDVISPGPDPAPLPAAMDPAKKDDGTVVVPISNLPQRAPLPDDIPDEYRFEIFRLRRQVSSLDSDNRRVNDKLTRALEVLHDELRFWRLGIYDQQWETLGQVMRRMRHLEAMIHGLEGPEAMGIQFEARKRRRT